MIKRRIAVVSCVSIVALACAFTLAGTARADILIRNVTLYDGTGAAAVKGANILVKGERIAQISTSPIQAGGAAVIDGTGKFVMPGIMDSHVHIRGGQGGSVREGNARRPIVDRSMALPTLLGYLYSGVTSVYDSGNNAPFIFPLRDDERADKIVSPRIFTSGGVISVPDGYGGGPTALKATTWEETKPQLEAKIEREKPDMLKLIRANPPTLSDEMIKNITGFALSKGVRSTIHSSTEANTTAAILNGVSAFAHPVIRERPSDALLKLLVDRKIPMSTTSVGYITIAKLQDEGGMAYLDSPLFKATMPEADLASEKGPVRDDYIKNGTPASFKAAEPTAKANLKRLFDAGVILTSGTDKAYGGYTHMELAFLASAGIPPAALIKIATLNGALYVGREKDLGSIESGKYADLLVLNADPGADVKNFQAINAVIKNGQQIDLAKLDLPVNRKK